ncbi:PREDICTED: cysteine-rich with EGF-like domain protein 2, partial [Rhagoletis zephyria]|uniref:cysteine-rich with EGF-like domain protein 2 n=1 Tax=Rhagoletis zephyria TaxID=28612 RepID=UPI0008113209
NLKNITDSRPDKNFLGTIDKLNEIKTNVEFSKLWDKLCFDIKTGQEDCRSLAAENKDIILSWWATPCATDIATSEVSSGNVIFNSLCISTLKSCCPDGHYGAECLPCIGFPNNICSNNGKCAGAGTRLGNGHCVCRKGYTGKDCSKCDKAFYQDLTLGNSNGNIQCLHCDVSCAETCFAGGPRGCHVCKKGYAWDNNFGCFDIDECDPETGTHTCSRNTFCINTEGSYQCYECDNACDSCIGDGPDACIKCAKGHKLQNGVCVNPNPKPAFPAHASPARYVTYLGLTAVPCIIFRHNIYLASLIGFLVSLYIIISERSLDTESGRSIDEWLQKVAPSWFLSATEV